MHHIQVNCIARRNSAMTPIKPNRICDQVYCRAGNLSSNSNVFSYISVVSTFSPPSYHIVDTNSTLVGLCPQAWHKLINEWIEMFVEYLVHYLWSHKMQVLVDDTTLERRHLPWTTTYFYFQYSHQYENRGETYELLGIVVVTTTIWWTHTTIVASSTLSFPLPLAVQSICRGISKHHVCY